MFVLACTDSLSLCLVAESHGVSLWFLSKCCPLEDGAKCPGDEFPFKSLLLNWAYYFCHCTTYNTTLPKDFRTQLYVIKFWSESHFSSKSLLWDFEDWWLQHCWLFHKPVHITLLFFKMHPYCSSVYVLGKFFPPASYQDSWTFVMFWETCF